MSRATEPIPILGGFCVRRLDADRCVDVRRMLFNWRVVVTRRAEGEPHELIDHGWCFFGHGHDVDGRPRTMASAYLAAMAAVEAWDGVGNPPGYDKQAF